MRPAILSVAVLALLCACDGGGSAPDGKGAPVSAPVVARSAAADAPPADDRTPAFVGPVWRAAPGSGVEAGTTYRFLRDGTLAIDAPHGTPATGEWRYAGGQLTLVEEGIAYPTDIVALDATRFVLRSHHPGGVLEIALTADAGGAPPRR